MTLKEADAIDEQNETLKWMAATLSALGTHEIDPFEGKAVCQLMRHLCEAISVQLTQIAKGPFTKE